MHVTVAFDAGAVRSLSRLLRPTIPVRKLLAHPAAYVAVYLAGMLPTYVLPFLGSNASLLRASARSMGVRDTTAPGLFALHLACLLGLCVVAFVRGGATGRRWLAAFPALALVFDLTPGLSLVPLVPTAMHLLALVLGGSGARRPAGDPA